MPKNVGNTSIEEIELGSGNRFTFDGLSKCRELVPDQGVLENLIMFPHRAWRHPRIRGDRSEIDLLAMGQSRNLQETAEVLMDRVKPSGRISSWIYVES